MEIEATLPEESASQELFVSAQSQTQPPPASPTPQPSPSILTPQADANEMVIARANTSSSSTTNQTTTATTSITNSTSQSDRQLTTVGKSKKQKGKRTSAEDVYEMQVYVNLEMFKPIIAVKHYSYFCFYLTLK